MGDPEAWARGIKDLLNWSAEFWPMKLGWVLIGIFVVIAAERLIRAWRSK